MKAKRVLIVSRRMVRKHKDVQWVSDVYLEICARRGVMPVIVPIAASTPHILQEYLSDYDGLLLVEGGDVHPQYYTRTWSDEQFEELDILKDNIELQCFAHAYKHKKPILGICRGMHIMNVALGGTLYADIHRHINTEKIHIDYDNYDTLRHKIYITPNTPLMNWYATDSIAVNSYHHQGIETLGNNLHVMARDDNNVIEAVYMPSYPFMVGLQFHPERMWSEYEGNKQVFSTFIQSL
ncbi:MAG: gamma-glutamyl-gamma-aminobutyrate hydrolase family protein [Bacteroidales bacterium]|nr:gamma-glutamyl-gamma-aminobutyrate hydrolase family protein [Bacteroidales bacterium]